MRKKRDFEDVTNSTNISKLVLQRSEKSLQQYQFMSWLDRFIQPRESRKSLVNRAHKMSQNNYTEHDDQYNRNEHYEGYHAINDFQHATTVAAAGGDSVSYHGNADEQNGERAMTPESGEHEGLHGNQLMASDADQRELTGLSNAKRPRTDDAVRAPTPSTTREQSMDEIELSLISKLISRMNQREQNKHHQQSESNSTKEIDGEDLFCQALASDLKQLPFYQRCAAKHDLQNVLFKHQMEAMEHRKRWNDNTTNTHAQNEQSENSRITYPSSAATQLQHSTTQATGDQHIDASAAQQSASALFTSTRHESPTMRTQIKIIHEDD